MSHFINYSTLHKRLRTIKSFHVCNNVIHKKVSTDDTSNSTLPLHISDSHHSKKIYYFLYHFYNTS